MAGLLPEGAEQRAPQQLRLGNNILNVSFDRPNSQTPTVLSGGLVIAVSPDEYVFAGTGLTVTFEAAGFGDKLGDKPGDQQVGLLSVEEGKYVNGQWLAGRRLNGDQTHQGRHLRLEPGRFGIQRIKLYRYR
jgi:beta-galactosidase GanA